MCFIKSKKYPQVSKIAEKNITVFKCMFTKGNILNSPYFGGIEYRIGERFTSHFCGLKNDEGFYSFKYYQAAFNFKRYIKGSKIIKCIIPKGTKYIEGYQYNYVKHYGVLKCFRSKEIIFKEKIIK